MFDQENINGKAVSLHPGTVRTEATRNLIGCTKVLLTILYPIFYIFSMDALHGA